MSFLAAAKAPEIDYQGMAPLFALVGGACIALLAGLLRGPAVQRFVVPGLAVAALLAAAGLSIWNWDPDDAKVIVEGALAVDTLAMGASILFFAAGLLTIVLAWRDESLRDAGAGEFHALLLGSIAGMVMLASAENLVTLFVGIELLSIPLYVMCATRFREEASLEAGLKYLVIGSVGSATLLYGLALVYGATGSTDLSGIAAAVSGPDAVLGATDPLFLTGIALAATGLAFKASVAPFHQWTPDVYQGAPTPITAFMAVATKAAAFTVFLRLFDEAFVSAQVEWGPALAVLATITIIIGNVGALGQRSLKRLLAWSGVAQAGYLLAGVVVGTTLGVEATMLYLAVYLLMNVGAFAVVIARERVSELGDDIESLAGLGAASPWLAWPMTICMLSLAGFPATAGFIGKFFLIDAAVSGEYAWLGVMIVVGSMISLGYYLRVIAVMWMGEREIELPTLRRRVRPVSGWSPEADAGAQPEVTTVAVLCAALTVAFGIYPGPLFDAADDIGRALGQLL
jgi:NADH-quinone oxidoreductase subunit N